MSITSVFADLYEACVLFFSRLTLRRQPRVKLISAEAADLLHCVMAGVPLVPGGLPRGADD